MKRKLFIREIFIYHIILTGLIIAAMCAFFISSYEIFRRELVDTSESFLKIYSNAFLSTAKELESYIINITTYKEDLAKIRDKDETTRNLAAISLSNNLNGYFVQGRIVGKSDIDMISVYDDTYNMYTDSVVNNLPYKEKKLLRKFIIDSVDNPSVFSYEWNFMQVDTDTFLYKILKNDGKAIGIFIRSEKLLKTLGTNKYSERILVLSDEQGRIGKIWESGNTVPSSVKNISGIIKSRYFVEKNDIIPQQLVLYCLTPKTNILKQIHSSMLFAVFFIGVATFFMFFILHYTKREILVPMNIMVNDMKRIEEGDYGHRIDDTFRNEEFRVLQSAANHMIDEIIGLKIHDYEKQIELQNMELKSIRLQLKPHFFINALTTISSLSRQKKNERIISYIDILSENVRYMFSAGLHTVPLKEEIRHVEDYFTMQNIKYPDCVFYFMDVPKELEDWKIPQMLIHTFVENEYKHVVSVDDMLTILIKVRKTFYKNEEMLLIEVEDDGNGYPQEILDLFAGRAEREKGKMIGLWSVKRMLELMYDRTDLLYLGNGRPKGCFNRIYIPEHVLHEISG